MPARAIEISPSLKPPLEGIHSRVVDIYPIGDIKELRAVYSNPNIPHQATKQELADYVQELHNEKKFREKKCLPAPSDLPADNDPWNTHMAFVDPGYTKLGLRNFRLSQDGTSIECEYCGVPMPAYFLFGQHKNPEIRAFGANTGACMTLVTSDGMLLIQDRSPENRKYGGVPGASVAGLIDFPEANGQPIDIIKVGTDQLITEGQEEIGLAPSVTRKVQFTGLETDKVELHTELTYAIYTDLDSGKIKSNALKNREDRDAVSFRENICFIKADPQSIEKLLTQVKCPLPMTHAGAFLMLGYELQKLERIQFESPEGWLRRVQMEMDANYAEIDRMSTLGKYDPKVTAAGQGLPSFRSELDRVFGVHFDYVECAWSAS